MCWQGIHLAKVLTNTQDSARPTLADAPGWEIATRERLNTPPPHGTSMQEGSPSKGVFIFSILPSWSWLHSLTHTHTAAVWGWHFLPPWPCSSTHPPLLGDDVSAVTSASPICIPVHNDISTLQLCLWDVQYVALWHLIPSDPKLLVQF